MVLHCARLKIIWFVKVELECSSISMLQCEWKSVQLSPSKCNLYEVFNISLKRFMCPFFALHNSWQNVDLKFFCYGEIEYMWRHFWNIIWCKVVVFACLWSFDDLCHKIDVYLRIQTLDGCIIAAARLVYLESNTELKVSRIIYAKLFHTLILHIYSHWRSHLRQWWNICFKLMKLAVTHSR